VAQTSSRDLTPQRYRQTPSLRLEKRQASTPCTGWCYH